MNDPNLPLETERWEPEEGSIRPQRAGKPVPELIGRFLIEGVLGSGSFGTVYLGRDEQLKRPVAIKVPHQHRMSLPADAESFLAEARVVASLDHPAIVPVYDVGQTDDGRCYVVSKRIEGADLKTHLSQQRLTFHDAACLAATLADALHYAHLQGIVHRDIKPANILLDAAGKPYISDFGLALRDNEFQNRMPRAGTPAYMSPEQARGEGHRVDGRSDIFSLGIVLYELLTGARPFKGRSSELLEQIATVDVRPPRQVDDRVPKELERICLKAMSKRAADRYTTAKDLADELRDYLTTAPNVPQEAHAAPASAPALSGLGSEPGATVIPKGLRSFDATDAEFFLELLPGPRDRTGVPDCVRFWRSRIEERDPNHTFAVGLVLGPSGCGKSSLVKAGLVPQLSGEILPVVVEAAPLETEARMLRALRHRFAALAEGETLIEALAALRKGTMATKGQKVLLVIDQFEQWLHGHSDPDSELELALRQCDGTHLQALLLVRDDFGMAAARFMDALEIPIVQGHNFATVDLFSIKHARRVLLKFGQAFGQLPHDAASLTTEQTRFLNETAEGLADRGQVVPVRLTLFAEMVKDRAWTPRTLKEVGGTEGVGVAFLERALASSTNPRHRRHQRAARGVLEALLPDQALQIRGQVASRDELLAASGYQQQPEEFRELIEILDAELRLVTPSEQEDPAARGGQRSYQLTHDYLVPSVREWLFRKRRETWRGRAQLHLEQLAAAWGQGRQPRFLPSLGEYLAILSGVPRRRRTVDQQALLRAAARRHGVRWGSMLLLFVAAGFLLRGYIVSVRSTEALRRAETQVAAVLSAPADGVPYVIEALRPNQEKALPLLRQRFSDESLTKSERLHAAYALAALGEVHVDRLEQAIEWAPPRECANLITALRLAETDATELLWQNAQVEDDTKLKARLAILSLYLGDSRAMKQALAFAPDPKYRTALIHALTAWHGELRPLDDWLSNEDAAFRSGLCTALGFFDPNDLPAADKAALAKSLLDLYLHSPDGSTHSAAGWTLRCWKIELPTCEASSTPPPGRDWFVNRLGMTMVRIPAGKFTHKDETAQEVELTRSYFAADREVTVAQYRQFAQSPAGKDVGKHSMQISPTDDCPMQKMTWFEALRFCNWLSEQEGRVACYTSPEGSPTEVWQLNRDANGYRLPTEAEWEHACRAGTATRYAFGDDADLLSSYGFYAMNSNDRAWPGGLKAPNAWGLFDMHGNVLEWCWDWFQPFNTKPTIDPPGPPLGSDRVRRGGGYHSTNLLDLGSSRRSRSPPQAPLFFTGLRVVCGDGG